MEMTPNSFVTCLMPHGTLRIDVPIMVFQIIKLKAEAQRRVREARCSPQRRAGRCLAICTCARFGHAPHAAHSHGHHAGVLPVPVRVALQFVGGAQGAVHGALLGARDHMVRGELADRDRSVRAGTRAPQGVFCAWGPGARPISECHEQTIVGIPEKQMQPSFKCRRDPKSENGRTLCNGLFL